MRWHRIVEPHDGDISERRSIVRRLTLRDNAGRSFLERRGIDVRLFGVYLHRITAPDPGLDLHDHPWPFVSIVLRGGYGEEVAPTRSASRWATAAETAVDVMRREGGDPARWHVFRGEPRSWRRGSVHVMRLTVAHRITTIEPGTLTLVLRGRKVRPWGFYTPAGWVDQRSYDYVTRRPGSEHRA